MRSEGVILAFRSWVDSATSTGDPVRRTQAQLLHLIELREETSRLIGELQEDQIRTFGRDR
jgi:hypothetical protein